MDIFFGLTGTQIGIACFAMYAVIAGIVTFKMVNDKTVVSLIIPMPHKIGLSLFGFAILPWMALAMLVSWIGSIGESAEEKTKDQHMKQDMAVQTSGLFIIVALLYGASTGLPLAYYVEHQNDKPVTNDTACVCKK